MGVLKSNRRSIQSWRRRYDLGLGRVVFVPTDCTQAEADALIRLYYLTDGDNWTNNTNWLTDPVVNNWFGVTTAGGVVTSLILNNNGLNGDGISPLAPLTSLSILRYQAGAPHNVSGDIAGLATMTSLTDVRLLNSAVSGDIADLAPLTLLTTLDAPVTNVSGDIASLAPLTSLTSLQLYTTTVSGDITNLNPLNLLQFLYLNGTNITGGNINANVAMRTCRVQDCGWNQATVDALLLGMYTNRAAFTYATPSLNIAGTNAAPSGIYASVCPPTTGKEYAFELVNKLCGGPAFNAWTVTFTP